MISSNESQCEDQVFPEYEKGGKIERNLMLRHMMYEAVLQTRKLSYASNASSSLTIYLVEKNINSNPRMKSFIRLTDHSYTIASNRKCMSSVSVYTVLE